MSATDHEWINGTLPRSRDSIWKTKEGQLVRIREMTDHHLLCTIRVLRGKSPHGTRFICGVVVRREWLNAMANEAYSRGLSLDEVDERDPVHE